MKQICLHTLIILSSSRIICIQYLSEAQKDRSSGTSRKGLGGGILVAGKSSIHSHETKIDTILESIFVSLSRRNLMINCVYIPPGQSISVHEAYDSIDELFTKPTSSSSFLLAGDFYIPTLDSPSPPEDPLERVKRVLFLTYLIFTL